MECIYYECVIGRLLLSAEEDSLVRAEFQPAGTQVRAGTDCYVQKDYTPGGVLPGKQADKAPLPVLTESCRQLDEYFAGKRKEFTVPLRAEGTEFQRRVWAALRKIPYGKTCSYGQIARQIGSPRAARAVGMGCNRNPLLLFIPCHRVVGSKGALTGFACGLPVKAELLMMEELFSREEEINRV